MNFLKQSIEIVFSPLGIMVLLMVGGVVLSAFRRYSRTGHRLAIAAVLMYLIFLFSPLAEFLILSLEKHYPPMLVPPSPPKIDTIVVLAGYGEEHPGFPVTSNVSDQTTCCLAEGVRLYRLLPGAKLIMSGGIARPGDKPVAALMADYGRQIGLPAQDVIVEGKSHNTYENLVEVKKLIGSRPFILVAAACDLRRAVGVAHRLEMNPFPAPACIWASQHRPSGMNALPQVLRFLADFAHPSQLRLIRIQWASHEYLGYIWYWLLGRV